MVGFIRESIPLSRLKMDIGPMIITNVWTELTAAPSEPRILEVTVTPEHGDAPYELLAEGVRVLITVEPGTCKACRWWPSKILRGHCLHPRMTDAFDEYRDGASDVEGCLGIDTGPDFGCIHYESEDINTQGG